MKKQYLPIILILIMFWGCSSKPLGRVVNITGSDTFQAKYIGQDLKIGDKVKIVKMETDPYRESSPPANRKVIGEGSVQKILEGNFYEIKTETSQHIPSDAYIEKF